MSSKKSSDSDRNALFGGSGGGGRGGPKHKRDAASNRNALFGDTAAGTAAGTGGRTRSAAAATSRPTSTTSSSSSSTNRQPNNQGYMSYKKNVVSIKKKKPGSYLSAEAKQAKLKEAEDYKQKANKCMERGFFTKPDPVAASTYFKRAADCYQQVGDLRMERFYRAASGDCNLQVGAWASAASDFTRAAELVFAEVEDKNNNNDDDDDHDVLAATKTAEADLVQLRRDAADFHKKAAEAWTQMNEKAKAAESQVKAALALNYGEDGTLLSKEAVTGLEEAVEAHVPDVLNPYARYRQTGHSAFIDPNSEETIEKPSAQAMELAESHIVSRAYSHEPLQELVYMFVKHGEYASALYAAGAATVILTRENMSTLSLSRAFCTETILQLAMGDPIAAEERFLNSHVQKTSYLSSRECKLSEELFRAIKMRDGDALEEARSPTGSNRAALANLHESLRSLVAKLRLSGVARKVMPGDKAAEQTSASRKKPSGNRKNKTSMTEAPPPPAKPETSLSELLQQKTGYEKDVKEGEALDSNDLQDELDALNFDGDDEGFGGGDDELDELEDDDIDLR